MTDHPTTPGKPGFHAARLSGSLNSPTSAASGRSGYTLVMLLFMVFLLTLGLLVAMPVWETQIRREMEDELIFRGRQYVEAIRVFQSQNPGEYPKSLELLFEENFLRRPFKDPMSDEGEWNVLLLPEGLPGAGGTARNRPVRLSGLQRNRRPDRPSEGRSVPESGESGGSGQSLQKLLVAPVSALESMDNPRIVGVVSSSTRSSIKIYYEQTSYDQWLFFLGFKPGNKMPEIEYYGSDEEKDRS